MDQPETVKDYEDLQKSIDTVIGRFGLKNTIFLLENFVNETSINTEESHKMRMISQYLITQCIKVFNLKDQHFFTSNIPEYREARMVCYEVLKKCTDVSYSKIAEDFGLTKRNVLYNCEKCREKLTVPFFYKSFTQKYDTIEKSLIHFISKINTEHDD